MRVQREKGDFTVWASPGTRHDSEFGKGITYREWCERTAKRENDAVGRAAVRIKKNEATGEICLARAV